jgi:TolB-like protein/DNA-binding winged helix-turn-helix (wHTH) protein
VTPLRRSGTIPAQQKKTSVQTSTAATSERLPTTCFGEFRLDRQSRELYTSHRRIRLQEQPFKVLALLLERPGEVVTRDELRQRLWPSSVYVDFDHGLNNALTRLREALGDVATKPRFIETIPRLGYRFIHPLEAPDPSGQRPADVAPRTAGDTRDWIDAAPPVNDLEAVMSAPEPQPTGRTSWAGRWRVLLLAGVAAIAIVALVVWLDMTSDAPSTVGIKPSLAVLPFEDLSAETGNEYFSDGMTEEVIGKLSRISELQVVARTSVIRFKGAQRDIREIARELGARYLLVGAVRKDGTHVRITTQLIDSESGFQLWAEDFGGELGDIFAFQEQTALQIAEALNLQLNTEQRQDVSRHSTKNPEAYDAYLRGRALAGWFDDVEKLQRARSEFERALEADPEYALALAGLAEVEAQVCRNVELSESCLRRTEELARLALAKDATMALPHVALAHVYGTRFDYARAEKELLRAVELDRNDPSAWMLLAWAHSYQQPPEAHEAEAAAREAIRLAFSFAPGYYQLGRAQMLQGRYDDAIASFDHAMKLNPGFAAPHVGMAQTYLAQGKYQQALEELGQWGDSRKTPHVVFQRSLIYAAQGEREKALQELERSLAGGYRDFAAIDATPYLSALRSEPRFQQLIRRYRN